MSRKYIMLFPIPKADVFTIAPILKGIQTQKLPRDSENAVSTLETGAKPAQTNWLGHTWGTPDHSAGSARGQRQQCVWWGAAQPSQQQQLTGLQCPWSAPAGRPTSSQAVEGRWRPESPSGGPSPPTALGACLPLHNHDDNNNKNHNKNNSSDNSNDVNEVPTMMMILKLMIIITIMKKTIITNDNDNNSNNNNNNNDNDDDIKDNNHINDDFQLITS